MIDPCFLALLKRGRGPGAEGFMGRGAREIFSVENPA